MSPNASPAAEPVWRPMVAADLARVQVIADIAHVDHPEGAEVFANRLALFPAGCLMAADGGGYCLAHPGKLGRAPALDTVLDRLPDGPDCLYLHDLALLPQARGLGLGRAAVAELARVARAAGLPRIALTAVGHSPAFWAGLGFIETGKGGASYGTALAMVLKL
ncbi:MAG: GNAT family N-acetyltransferase [Alphaproteobacteria bacterium]|nr:GNAT family N-acetyltransferase [Alphaproteobacteria bacterium]